MPKTDWEKFAEDAGSCFGSCLAILFVVAVIALIAAGAWWLVAHV